MIDYDTDQLYLYDSAVVEWIRKSPLHPDGEELRVVFATPDRAFAEVGRDVAEGTDATSTSPPMPMVSLMRNAPEFDPERFHGSNTQLTGKTLGYNEDQTLAYTCEYPMPFNINYEIEIWSRTRSMLNRWQQHVLGTLGVTPAYITVDFTQLWTGWGHKLIAVLNGGQVDNSDLEPDEGERVLRMTQTITVQAWLMPKVSTEKTILEVQTAQYLYADPINTTAPNLLVAPNTVADPPWSLSNITATNSYTANPVDGTVDAPKIEASGSGTVTASFTPSFDVKSGQSYTFSVWLRAESQTTTELKATSAALPLSDEDTLDVNVTGEWQQVSLQHIAVDDGADVQFQMTIADGTSVIFYDVTATLDSHPVPDSTIRETA